jgi:hypothetical protein
MPIVEEILMRKPHANRQRKLLGHLHERSTRVAVPSTAADDNKRPLRGGKTIAAAATCATSGAAAIGSTRGASAQSARADSMSSGTAKTTGPGRPDIAIRYACATYSGIRSARSICAAHFATAAEHAPVVDLLECLAIDHVAPNLPDEQDHRRRILRRSVDADTGVRRTRTRVTNAMPGRPVNLPKASAMYAAPPSCLHTMSARRSRAS